MLGAAADAAGGVISPNGDVNSAVGHGRVTHRHAQRVALRATAKAALARSGMRLRFEDTLETLYEVDQTPARVRELNQVNRLAIGVYLFLVVVINLLIVPTLNLIDLAVQLTIAPALALLTGHFLYRQNIIARWREAAVTVSCCGYSLATAISVCLSPPETFGNDVFLITLPVIGVLFFARQPFGAALFFTGFSVCCLLGVLLLHPDMPVAQLVYPMVFLLAAAMPALLGVHRLEHSARRVWLLRLLQSLRADDLASENVELSEQAASALRASEERLRQAQKMEAVGQLTGGIAHDFNNLLTTIIGSLEMLQGHGRLDQESERLAENALAGAERGARLTGQLLAFSRLQILAPTRLIVAAVVSGIGELLARTLGETTALRVRPAGSDQWDALADRNQLEMAVLNLVINARDAIGDRGGAVDIEFANLSLTEQAAAALTSDPVQPGDYVRISVSDTGDGMSPDILARACEPFFTTKPAGGGTGLGLSQTYGFATQSGGTLVIDSTPGSGTRVAILLPRARDTADAPLGGEAAAPAPRGETVLVVEDDAMTRETIIGTLTNVGYRVLSAADAATALAVLDAGSRIDVLLTDVLMVGSMNGVALALAARRRHPGLKVLFSTGFADSAMLASWPGDLNLIPKPFSAAALVCRVARCLNAPPACLAPEVGEGEPEPEREHGAAARTAADHPRQLAG